MAKLVNHWKRKMNVIRFMILIKFLLEFHSFFVVLLNRFYFSLRRFKLQAMFREFSFRDNLYSGNGSGNSLQYKASFWRGPSLSWKYQITDSCAFQAFNSCFRPLRKTIGKVQQFDRQLNQNIFLLIFSWWDCKITLIQVVCQPWSMSDEWVASNFYFTSYELRIAFIRVICFYHSHYHSTHYELRTTFIFRATSIWLLSRYFCHTTNFATPKRLPLQISFETTILQFFER